MQENKSEKNTQNPYFHSNTRMLVVFTIQVFALMVQKSQSIKPMTLSVNPRSGTKLIGSHHHTLKVKTNIPKGHRGRSLQNGGEAHRALPHTQVWWLSGGKALGRWFAMQNS